MPSPDPDVFLDALLGHDRDMTAYLMTLSEPLDDAALDRESTSATGRCGGRSTTSSSPPPPGRAS